MGLNDTSSIDRAHAYRIQRVGRLLRLHLHRLLQPHDLTPEQFILLFRLHEQDGRIQGELADPAIDDRANITRLVDQLVRAGLAVRERDPDDGRRRRVFLTDAGRARIEGLFPTMMAARAALFDGFSDEELALLVSLLDRVEARLG